MIDLKGVERISHHLGGKKEWGHKLIKSISPCTEHVHFFIYLFREHPNIDIIANKKASKDGINSTPQKPFVMVAVNEYRISKWYNTG